MSWLCKCYRLITWADEKCPYCGKANPFPPEKRKFMAKAERAEATRWTSDNNGRRIEPDFMDGVEWAYHNLKEIK